MREYRGKTKDRVNPNYMPPRFLDEDEVYNVPAMINGKWVEGSWVDFGTQAFIGVDVELELPDDTTIPYCSMYGFVEVHPETVGQSTGLKDKAGTEAYRGDKVSYSQKKDGIIQYNINKSRWEIFWSLGDIVGIDKHWFETEIEIIGNIHDNPELKG